MRSTNKKETVSLRSLLAVLFASLMLVGSLALVGCGGSNGSSEGSSEGQTESQKEPEPTRTAEEAAVGYVQAVFDGDGNALWELLPPELQDSLMEEIGGDEDDVVDELENTISDSMGSSLDGMEDYINGFTVTAEDSKDLSSSEVDDLIDTYSSDYDLDLNIEEAQEVDLTIGLDLTPAGEEALEQSGADASDAETSLTVVAIKVDGEWYFDMTSLL